MNMNLGSLWLIFGVFVIVKPANNLEDMISVFIFHKVEAEILCEKALISMPNLGKDNLTSQLLDRVEYLESVIEKLTSTIEQLQKVIKG